MFDGYLIYALIDPRDGAVRYIGITDNVSERFAGHLGEVGGIATKGQWLADLQRYGLQPTVEILEKVQVKKKRATYSKEESDTGYKSLRNRGHRSLMYAT